MHAMIRPLVPLLVLTAALPALAQGPVDPAGRLPPVASPAQPAPPGETPRRAVPVERTPATLPHGAILEQVSGTVVSVDRQAHRFTIDAAGQKVELSMDRNTMVYTPSGLGTVLDVVPGAPVRAGRNAELVAYWVQVRPVPGKSPTTGVESTQGQGTGPAGGSAAAASEPRGGPPPSAGGSATPATPGPGGRP
jgi:hypothetical protein